jgi:hypothetical protein
MVSMTVMILNCVFALIVIVNVSSMDFGYSQYSLNNSTNKSIDNVTYINRTGIDLILNPDFTFFNETSGLPSYWNDTFKTCSTTFSCTIKFTDGWNDYVSFALSTTNNTKNTWSTIYGMQIEVKPMIKYQLISHMKLNEWATQSHVAVEGFNETSKIWFQIAQCPTGIDGPLNWQEFSCLITIPDNTHKIRAVLNAGWSSLPNKDAATWFDSVKLITLPL